MSTNNNDSAGWPDPAGPSLEVIESDLLTLAKRWGLSGIACHAHIPAATHAARAPWTGWTVWRGSLCGIGKDLESALEDLESQEQPVALAEAPTPPPLTDADIDAMARRDEAGEVRCSPPVLNPHD